MSIFTRQYNSILSAEVLKFLLRGVLPNVTELSRRVSESLTRDGVTLYQYIPQGSRVVFNWKLYNTALKQIKFDIDVFYEELLDLFNVSLSRVNYADLYHKVNSYHLSKLDTELKNLLFTVENADYYFLGAYDTFSDLTKTDRTNTTEGIVDLKEQALSLPYGARGVSRVKTSHLYKNVTWPVTIEEGSEYTESSSLVPGTKFGNIFSDTVSTWAYEVRTNKQEPVEIKFKFPLAGSQKDNVEVFINKIEIIPHSTNKQLVKIRVSNDNVNYLSITGYENGLTLDNQAITYSMDFETNLVQYLEVTLRKESPDSEITIGDKKLYQYIFGLKSLSAYTVGRYKKAVYYSVPFTFGDESDKISKVSITTNDLELPGTSIEYSVALDTEEPNFVPIVPTGKSKKDLGVNQVVEFNSTSEFSNRIVVPEDGDDAAIAYGQPYQGKTIYRIGDPITPKPLFGTVSMFRGYNCWYRDTSSAFQLKNISDVYISFATTNVESLYDIKKEIVSHTYLPNRRVTELSLSNVPYYNAARGHSLIPDPSFQGTSSNLQPNYAIYSVKQLTTVARKSITFNLTSRNIQLSATNIDISTVDNFPTLYETSNRNKYRYDLDYDIAYNLVGGIKKSTGVLRIPDGSDLLNSSGQVRNIQVTLEYTPDQDITHKVSNIYGNKLTLTNCIVAPSDTIQVEYRFVPKAPSQIIKSSIRVSAEPKTGNIRTFYEEGTDYVVDQSTGAIQKVPTGSIPANGSVYAEFSYRSSEEGIETFQIWAYVSSSQGTRINFDSNTSTKKNKLVANKSLGEAFYVNTPDGLIDITSALVTPLLKTGWVQFIVRSKNPDINTRYTTNLIDQVVQLRDQNKKKIFKSGGLYFREITAFIEPMEQKTLNHLRVNTLKTDYSSFAIDSTTDPLNHYVVLNFLPNSTSELYRKAPTDEAVTDGAPQEIYESFLMRWQSKNTTDTSTNKLIVRISLERSDEVTDGGVTPKVYSYDIRASV